MIQQNFSNLPEVAAKYKHQYLGNNPFPNLYFDDFFDEDFLQNVLEEFPDLDKLDKRIHYKNPNENKYATQGEYCFGKKTKELVHFLNSQPFLEFLQELTGIEETLMPDPYFLGGGYHQIKPMGFLKIHVDFHKHLKMKLDRRLNLIIYLNKDWKDEYGGHFELWERDMSKLKVKISPLFNRLVLFSTTSDSWHGHPEQLTCPPDRTRKSIALYYYTNGRPENELGKFQQNRVITTFAARNGNDTFKMKVYNNIVNTLNMILPDYFVKLIKTVKDKHME